MSARAADMTIADGTELVGQVRGGDLITIHGSVEGTLVTRRLLIGPTGRFKGSLKADEALIHGTLRGEATIQHLISVSQSGDVAGRIRYGSLSLERGARFDADVKNVPPELAGDFEISVARGGQVALTPADLNATDADNGANQLTFTASGILNGHLARVSDGDAAIQQFTQAEIDAGQIVFVHNGKGRRAGFDVIVADADGATAGGARPVMVRVEE